MCVFAVLLVNFLDDGKLEVVGLQRELNLNDKAKRDYLTFPTAKVPLRRVAVPAKATAEMRPKNEITGTTRRTPCNLNLDCQTNQREGRFQHPYRWHTFEAASSRPTT